MLQLLLLLHHQKCSLAGHGSCRSLRFAHVLLVSPRTTNTSCCAAVPLAAHVAVAGVSWGSVCPIGQRNTQHPSI
jgi:hypothetical protein